MKTLESYADLRRFGKTVLTTGDAAARLRTTLSAASRIMARLVGAGLAVSLKRGLWSLSADTDPLQLPDHLTAPYPSYVSLQTALFYHGMISQIPQVIYAASLGRTRRIKTSIATYSIHRLAPEFFGGFQTDEDGIKLATPEKALLDVLYLSAARSRLFARLPELELTSAFSRKECRRWIDRIPAAYRRKMVADRLDAVLRVGSRSRPRTGPSGRRRASPTSAASRSRAGRSR